MILHVQTLVARVYKHGGGVICQAYGNVKVGIPSSVMLNTQSDQIGVGMEMPIYPLFPEARCELMIIRNHISCGLFRTFTDLCGYTG